MTKSPRSRDDTTQANAGVRATGARARGWVLPGILAASSLALGVAPWPLLARDRSDAGGPALAADRLAEREGAESCLPPGHPPIGAMRELPPAHPPAGATSGLPPGHPPLGAMRGLPPGHPPVARGLPPGHPPIGAVRGLPPGHPPVDDAPALPPGHPPVGPVPRELPRFDRDAPRDI